MEQESFAKAVSSAACKGLVHFFFASRETAAVPGVTDVGLKPRAAKCVGVVGGGLMGSGIATACVLNGIRVELKEINQKFLDAGMGRIKANLQSNVKKGRMTQDKADKIFSLCHPTLSYDDFAKVDMAIEAVIENLDLKQKIFADLESGVPPGLHPVDEHLHHRHHQGGIEDAQSRAHRRRALLLPGARHAAVRDYPHGQDAPQVLCDVLGLSKQIKKTPVMVGNCTGFAVNRVFFLYTMSACLLVDLGCDPYAIDNAIRMFGMPMGPFRLSDLVGTDIGVHVGKNFVDDFPERVYESRLIPSLMAANRLGEKSGAGFYTFDAKRAPFPTPRESLIFSRRRARGGGAEADPSRAPQRPHQRRHRRDDLLPRGERGVPVFGRRGGCARGRSGHRRHPRHGLSGVPRRRRALGGPDRSEKDCARSGGGARDTAASTTRAPISKIAPCRTNARGGSPEGPGQIQALSRLPSESPAGGRRGGRRRRSSSSVV